MTLLQLKYFIQVCRCGNMTRAAQQLHISQPSLSEAIRNLEEEFAMPLLKRGSRGVSPTPNGEVFLREAQKLADAEAAFLLRMQSLSSAGQTLHIGVPPMLETLIFPKLLAAYCRLFPQYRLEAAENGTTTNLELIRRGVLEAAVVSSAEVALPEPFRVRDLCQIAVDLYLSSDTPTAAQTSVSLTDCAELPLVLLSPDTFLAGFMEERFSAAGVAPRIIMRTDQLTAIRQMIDSGTAAAFLYQDVLPPAEHVRQLSVRDLPAVRIRLVWHADYQSMPALQALLHAADHAFPPGV